MVGRPTCGTAADTEETRDVSWGLKCIRTDTKQAHFEFGSARWAGVFVRGDPNGHGRSKWVALLELLLVFYRENSLLGVGK